VGQVSLAPTSLDRKASLQVVVKLLNIHSLITYKLPFNGVQYDEKVSFIFKLIN